MTQIFRMIRVNSSVQTHYTKRRHSVWWIYQQQLVASAAMVNQHFNQHTEKKIDIYLSNWYFHIDWPNIWKFSKQKHFVDFSTLPPSMRLHLDDNNGCEPVIIDIEPCDILFAYIRIERCIDWTLNMNISINNEDYLFCKYQSIYDPLTLRTRKKTHSKFVLSSLDLLIDVPV